MEELVVIIQVIIEHGPSLILFICVVFMSNRIKTICQNLEEIKKEIADSDVCCPHCQTPIPKKDLRWIENNNKLMCLCKTCGNKISFR